MPVKVVQWGTGHVGGYALRGIVRHPELELVGVGVYTADKVGRDAGQIGGIDPIGIEAVHVDDAAGIDADCVVHTPGFAGSERNPEQTLDEVCRLLAAGRNVASTALMALVHPRSMSPEARARIEDACSAGGTAFHSTGINPGFFFDVFPGLLSGLTSAIRQVRCYEIYNYEAKEDVSIVGFGGPPAPPQERVRPLKSELRMNMDTTLWMLAQALGIEIDEVHERSSDAVADETFSVRAGTIERGAKAGYRHELVGYASGAPLVAYEFIGRAAPHVSPDWAPPAAGFGNHRWAVEIDGMPRVQASVEVTIEPDDEIGITGLGGLAGSAAIAMRAVNAVPALCAGPRGIRTTLDLGITPGRPLVQPTLV